jgi:hypothetical protein
MRSSRAKSRPGEGIEGRQPDEGLEPLTPEERTRLLAELEAEFEAAERSIREEGVVTAEELERHLDALLLELKEQEQQEKRSAKR